MWPNPLETADLVTFTEEILNGKLHVLCNAALGMDYFKNKSIIDLWQVFKSIFLHRLVDIFRNVTKT